MTIAATLATWGRNPRTRPPIDPERGQPVYIIAMIPQRYYSRDDTCDECAHSLRCACEPVGPMAAGVYCSPRCAAIAIRRAASYDPTAANR